MAVKSLEQIAEEQFNDEQWDYIGHLFPKIKTPEARARAINAAIKYADLIKSYPETKIIDVAHALNMAAVNAPEKLDDVATLIGKYEGKTVEIVANALQAAALAVPDYLDIVIGTIRDFPHADLTDCVAQEIESIIVQKQKDDKNRELLERFCSIINRHKGESARWAAEAFNKYMTDSTYEERNFLFDSMDAVADEKAFVEFQKSRLDVKDEFFNFSKAYELKNIEDEVKIDKKANQQLYRQGLQLIKGIKKGSIALSPPFVPVFNAVESNATEDTPLLPIDPEAVARLMRIARGEVIETDVDRKLTEYKSKLEESRGKDDEAKKSLYELKRKIREGKQLMIKSKRKELKDNYSIAELKEELNQMAQHWLAGKPAILAKKISRKLVVEEEKFDADTLEMSVWRKSFADMPKYKDYNCCCFAGGKENSKSVINYVLNPAIQLIHFKAGDREAMAIVASTADYEHGKKKTLFVDSLESKSSVFGWKSVAGHVLKGLMDYAKAAGFEQMLVSCTPENPVPLNFYEKIPGKFAELQDLVLDAKFPKPYLEAFDTDLDGNANITLWVTGKLYRL